MANTYGTSGVTYGLAGGTYGAWGAVSSPAGGGMSGTQRETDSSFSKQFGALEWLVSITGVGSFVHDGDVLYVPDMVPSGASGSLRLGVRGLSCSIVAGHDAFSAVTAELAITGAGMAAVGCAAVPVAFDDPPDLLRMLGLPPRESEADLLRMLGIPDI